MLSGLSACDCSPVRGGGFRVGLQLGDLSMTLLDKHGRLHLTPVQRPTSRCILNSLDCRICPLAGSSSQMLSSDVLWNSLKPPVFLLTVVSRVCSGSNISENSSPTSLSASERASTIKSEPNMAPSPYAGQTVTSACQVDLSVQTMDRCVLLFIPGCRFW